MLAPVTRTSIESKMSRNAQRNPSTAGSRNGETCSAMCVITQKMGTVPNPVRFAPIRMRRSTHSQRRRNTAPKMESLRSSASSLPNGHIIRDQPQERQLLTRVPSQRHIVDPASQWVTCHVMAMCLHRIAGHHHRIVRCPREALHTTNQFQNATSMPDKRADRNEKWSEWQTKTKPSPTA